MAREESEAKGVAVCLQPSEQWFSCSAQRQWLPEAMQWCQDESLLAKLINVITLTFGTTSTDTLRLQE